MMLPLLLVPALSISLNALSLPNALLFEALRDQDGRSVLFIRDCGRGNIPRDVSSLGVAQCEEWQSSFSGRGRYRRLAGDSVDYIGDAAVLQRMLQQQRFDEAWLFSGGGDLFSGVAVGQLLRGARLTVRVPSVARVQSVLPWPQPNSNVRCVSACTVAFMGGLFRHMDEGSSYEMHSASGVGRSVRPALVRLLMAGRLSEAIESECAGGRYWTAKLFRFFQNTLLLSTRYPQVVESEREYEEFGNRGAATMMLTPDDEARDRDRIQREGLVALQDIYMRYERGCVNAAVQTIRQTPAAREPRAEAALRIVEAMYEVSIKDTQSLTRDAMLRLGILTQELQSPPSP